MTFRRESSLMFISNPHHQRVYKAFYLHVFLKDTELSHVGPTDKLVFSRHTPDVRPLQCQFNRTFKCRFGSQSSTSGPITAQYNYYIAL